MAARWGVTEWRNRSVSRHEETCGWLGQQRHDPAADADDCHRCHGDGAIPPNRYCQCPAGQALKRSDLELLSEAALTPHEGREAA